MKSLFPKVFHMPNKGISTDFKICPIKYSLYFIQYLSYICIYIYVKYEVLFFV